MALCGTVLSSLTTAKSFATQLLAKSLPCKNTKNAGCFGDLQQLSGRLMCAIASWPLSFAFSSCFTCFSPGWDVCYLSSDRSMPLVFAISCVVVHLFLIFPVAACFQPLLSSMGQLGGDFPAVARPKHASMQHTMRIRGAVIQHMPSHPTGFGDAVCCDKVLRGPVACISLSQGVLSCLRGRPWPTSCQNLHKNVDCPTLLNTMHAPTWKLKKNAGIQVQSAALFEMAR